MLGSQPQPPAATGGNHDEIGRGSPTLQYARKAAGVVSPTPAALYGRRVASLSRWCPFLRPAVHSCPSPARPNALTEPRRRFRPAPVSHASRGHHENRFSTHRFRRCSCWADRFRGRLRGRPQQCRALRPRQCHGLELELPSDARGCAAVRPGVGRLRPRWRPAAHGFRRSGIPGRRCRQTTWNDTGERRFPRRGAPA